MIRPDVRPRYAALILVVALLASLVVAVFRFHTESQAKRVEIAMDYTDFIALARSYNYNPAAFLIALRRAGLTSLALTEELGANVGDDGRAYATTGAALINQARISPIADPLLAALVRSNKIARNAVYLIVDDPAASVRRAGELQGGLLHLRQRGPGHVRHGADRPSLRERRPRVHELHDGKQELRERHVQR